MRNPIAITLLGALNYIARSFVSEEYPPNVCQFPAPVRFSPKNHEKTIIFSKFFGRIFFQKLRFFYFFPRYFRAFLQRFPARLAPCLAFIDMNCAILKQKIQPGES